MKYNTVEIMEKGMTCLVERLGVVDAEHFISVALPFLFPTCYNAYMGNKSGEPSLPHRRRKGFPGRISPGQ